MLGRQERWQEDLFVAGPLSDLIPEDHVLKCVDRVLDLSWLRDEVRDLYCEDNGRPSIDPEAAVRLMLAGLFQHITKDRRLMREAQVNLAIRWFAGYRLHENLPHHSALTKIRMRWGEAKFRSIFERTVRQCAAHGLVSGETVHIDATLIRADVSWESLVERHVDRVIEENADEAPDASHGNDSGSNGPSRSSMKSRSLTNQVKKVSRTDPQATLTTAHKFSRMEPCYKQHTAVDDHAGVIVDVHVTTGEASEGKELLAQIDRIETRTGVHVETTTADAGYGHAANYGELEHRGTDAVIPPQRVSARRGRIPLPQFRYDARNAIVRCPMGKVMNRSSRSERGWMYRAKTSDCRSCPLRAKCVPKTAQARTVRIVDDYPALVRARRRAAQRDDRWKQMYRRHRSMVEGVHGESKSQHGLHRAMRRGRVNVAIQCYLTAAVINLKRLAKALSPRALGDWWTRIIDTSATHVVHLQVTPTITSRTNRTSHPLANAA